jgi:hypothetical protein
VGSFDELDGASVISGLVVPSKHDSGSVHVADALLCFEVGRRIPDRNTRRWVRNSMATGSKEDSSTAPQEGEMRPYAQSGLTTLARTRVSVTSTGCSRRGAIAPSHPAASPLSARDGDVGAVAPDLHRPANVFCVGPVNISAASSEEAIVPVSISGPEATIVGGPTAYNVSSALVHDDEVLAHPPSEPILADAVEHRVVTSSAPKEIAAGTCGDPVVVLPSEQPVAPSAAQNDVGSSGAAQHVVSASPPDVVDPASSADHISVRCADELVVPSCSDDRARRRGRCRRPHGGHEAGYHENPKPMRHIEDD